MAGYAASASMLGRAPLATQLYIGGLARLYWAGLVGAFNLHGYRVRTWRGLSAMLASSEALEAPELPGAVQRVAPAYDYDWGYFETADDAELEEVPLGLGLLHWL